MPEEMANMVVTTYRPGGADGLIRSTSTMPVRRRGDFFSREVKAAVR